MMFAAGKEYLREVFASWMRKSRSAAGFLRRAALTVARISFVAHAIATDRIIDKLMTISERCSALDPFRIEVAMMWCIVTMLVVTIRTTRHIAGLCVCVCV